MRFAGSLALGGQRSETWKPPRGAQSFLDAEGTAIQGRVNPFGNIGLPASDGDDIWVPGANGYVASIHGSNDGFLGTWTGATAAAAVTRSTQPKFATSDGVRFRLTESTTFNPSTRLLEPL